MPTLKMANVTEVSKMKSKKEIPFLQNSPIPSSRPSQKQTVCSFLGNLPESLGL